MKTGAPSGVNLDLDPDARAFRAEVRAWLAAHVPDPPLPSVDTAEGFARAPGLGARARRRPGWSVVSWPREYGGRDAPLLEWLIFEEEYYAAGAPGRVSQNGIFLLAPTLFEHGTAEQRDRLLPPMARADEVWAQAWSEPEAGSDLAAIRVAAAARDRRRLAADRPEDLELAGGVRRPGVRPVPHRPRGRAAPRADLLDVRPARAAASRCGRSAQLDGEPGFAEIFLDDVFVPDADVLGAPGDGWRVAMSTASNERGLSLRSPGRFLRRRRPAGRAVAARPRPADTALRDRVADAWIGAQAYQLYTCGTVAAAGRRRRRSGAGVQPGQGVLVRARRRAARDRARPARPRDARDWRDGALDRRLPVLARRPDLRRHQRDPAQRRSPSGCSACRGEAGCARASSRARPASPAGAARPAGRAPTCPARRRRLGRRRPGAGLALWRRLAELGVTALAVPESWGGLGASPLDLVVACEELGHHAAARPGGRVARRRARACSPRLGAASTLRRRGWLRGAGRRRPDRHAGRAAAAAVRGRRRRGRPGAAGRGRTRVRLAAPGPGAPLGGPRPGGCSRSAAARAGQRPRGGRRRPAPSTWARWPARRSCSARAGRCSRPACGTPASRVQFGRPIGAFQAVKHQLADVAIGLEFARPLLRRGRASRWPTALPTAARDVSAAKVACADAAHRAARTALQVHGAIGYTAEHDLSLWLTKVRALVPAWGSQAEHRAVVHGRAHPSRRRTAGGPASWQPRPAGGGMELTSDQRALRDAVRGLLARHQGDRRRRARGAGLWRRDRRRRAGHPRALRRRRRRPGGDRTSSLEELGRA